MVHSQNTLVQGIRGPEQPVLRQDYRYYELARNHVAIYYVNDTRDTMRAKLLATLMYGPNIMHSSVLLLGGAVFRQILHPMYLDLNTSQVRIGTFRVSDVIVILITSWTHLCMYYSSLMVLTCCHYGRKLERPESVRGGINTFQGPRRSPLTRLSAHRATVHIASNY